MQGTIKAYLPDKRYGFIKGDDGRDYFFHASDLLSACDAAKLCEAVRMRFASVTTSKGDRAKALVLDQEIVAADTFIEPDRFVTSRAASVDGWAVLERSDWLVHGASRGDPKTALREAISHAQSIGANGLVDLEYFKTTGSEPGTGSGIHHFTIHHFRGRAVMLGKRHAKGRPRQDILGINLKAENHQHKLKDEERQTKARRRLWVLAALGALAVMLFSDGPLHGLAPLFGLVVGVVFFVKWYRSRFDFKNADENTPLFFAPVSDVKLRHAKKSPKTLEQQFKISNHSGIRGFTVDEQKLAAAIRERQQLINHDSSDRVSTRRTHNIDGTPMMGVGILDMNLRLYGDCTTDDN